MISSLGAELTLQVLTHPVPRFSSFFCPTEPLSPHLHFARSNGAKSEVEAWTHTTPFFALWAACLSFSASAAWIQATGGERKHEAAYLSTFDLTAKLNLSSSSCPFSSHPLSSLDDHVSFGFWSPPSVFPPLRYQHIPLSTRSAPAFFLFSSSYFFSVVASPPSRRVVGRVTSSQAGFYVVVSLEQQAEVGRARGRSSRRPSLPG